MSQAAQRVALAERELGGRDVGRDLIRAGPIAVRRGHGGLAGTDVIRINNRILLGAGAMLSAEVRSLDVIHLATAHQLGTDLGRVVTYDERMAAAARELGMAVAAPS